MKIRKGKEVNFKKRLRKRNKRKTRRIERNHEWPGPYHHAATRFQ